MKRKANKWLLGCGIGCGAVLLIVIMLFGGAFFFLRSVFEGIALAVRSHDAVVAAGGEVGDYVPAADGSIPAARMEVFLGVRESLGEEQGSLEGVFMDFPPEGVEEGEGSVLKLFSIVNALKGMITPIGEYVIARNEALIQSGMGIGEYVYIYSLAYYSFLEHSPEDGPMVTKRCCPGSERERLFGGEDATYGVRKVRRRYRQYMLALLRNRIEALPAAPTGVDGPDPRSALQAELDRLESSPARTAWEEGLPRAIEASLSPYRERLEATYHGTTNCFEMPLRETEDYQKWSR